MPPLIKIPHDESIAAVKWQGQWRFFYDADLMFLLDYTKYDDAIPEEWGFRYGTLVVDESNIERWMDSMHGELTAEQIPYTGWADDEQVQLTFVIDFDVKLWVGYLWQNDQSAYEEYQPEGWLAVEDDVFNYLPIEIVKLWDKQLITSTVIISINDRCLPLIHQGSRAGRWGAKQWSIQTTIDMEIVHIFESDGVQTRDSIYQCTIPNNEWVDVRVSYTIEWNRDINLRIDLQRDGYLLRHVEKVSIKASH